MKNIEEQDIDWDKVKRRFRFIFSPSQSPIRSHIGILATKNAFALLDSAKLPFRPTTQWYAEQLSKMGITHNYLNVRRNLLVLKGWGILDEIVTEGKLVTKTGVRTARVLEYHLPHIFAEALRETLLSIFRVDRISLDHLTNHLIYIYKYRPLQLPTPLGVYVQGKTSK